jgi:UDP-glucose 4-epimerase
LRSISRRRRIEKQPIAFATVDVVWGDVRDTDAVGTVVADADAVVHLAAVIPPRSERDPYLTELVNVGGTAAVVEAVAQARRRPRLVHASSLSVYGRTQHKSPPRRVDDPLDPAEHYGHTKAAAEGIVRASAGTW